LTIDIRRSPNRRDDEARPQLSLAAGAAGNSDLAPAASPVPLSGGFGSASRTQAVAPTATAPITANACCHSSAGTLSCAARFCRTVAEQQACWRSALSLWTASVRASALTRHAAAVPMGREIHRDLYRLIPIGSVHCLRLRGSDQRARQLRANRSRNASASSGLTKQNTTRLSSPRPRDLRRAEEKHRHVAPQTIVQASRPIGH
jgi:hypothetical protein